MTTSLRRELGKCTSGHHALRLEVRVVRFESNDAGHKLLIGGSNDIRGSVQFIDLATNLLVSDYDIDRSVSGGGLFPALALMDAEADPARSFANKVCDTAFKKES